MQATGIAASMSTIRDVTLRSTAETRKTASSVEKLAELANDLRTSVAGFKLPGEDAQATERASEMSVPDEPDSSSEEGMQIIHA